MKYKQYKIMKTEFGSYCVGGIPDGCKFCIKGEKLVLFVTGKCNTKCKYCPLSRQRKNSDKVWANERECKSVKEVLEEAKESNSEGAGITGGDPMLVLGKTIRYAEKLKEKFGKGFHIHIYLSTTLVNEKNLRRLSKVVDEVRFHPAYLLDINKRQIDIQKIKLASKFFKKGNIGVEVPLFPDKKKEILEFIKKSSEHISFVNLNEMEIGESNFHYVTNRYGLNKSGYTVSGSISSGLWIMKQCIKEGLKLKIHLCTATTKNWFQYKNRLLRHRILPFGKRTKYGTVIYYFISRKNNENRFDELKRKISAREGQYDKKKDRIILNRKFLKKYSDFVIGRAEEYPTWDGIEVEAQIFS